MTFTEKQKLAEECSNWMTKNNISLTPFNVIAFLDSYGMIRKQNTLDNNFYQCRKDIWWDESIKDVIVLQSLIIRALMVSGIISFIFMTPVLTKDIHLYWLTPKYMYDNTGMNWLGVALSFVCLFPFLSFYYIGTFVYWICHLGKKKKGIDRWLYF